MSPDASDGGPRWVFHIGRLEVGGSAEACRLIAEWSLSLVVLGGCLWVILAPTETYVTSAATTVVGLIVGHWFGNAGATLTNARGAAPGASTERKLD